MTLTSRRELLAGIGVLGGVGVGAGLLKLDRGGDDLAASATRSAVALPQTLHAVDVRQARPGAVAGKLPPVGTPALPYGRLATPDGAHLGTFDTSFLQGGRAPMHLQQLSLSDGVIVGLGPARQEGTFTIVGATGSFSGAAGAYTVRRGLEGTNLEFAFDPTPEA